MKAIVWPTAALLLVTVLTACGGATPQAPVSSAASAGPASAGTSGPAASGSAAAFQKAITKLASPVSLRIGINPTINTLPVLAPADDGTLAKLGFNVSITPNNDVNQIMVGVAGGTLDAGSILIGLAALNALNRGSPFKMVASSGANAPACTSAGIPKGCGPNQLPLLIRQDLWNSGKVKSVADLKGMKIGLPGPTAQDYNVAVALQPGGLKPSDVDIISLAGPAVLAAFQNKALDGAFLGYPLVNEAINQGLARILTDTFSPNQTNTVIIFNSDYLAQHPDAVATFLEVDLQEVRKMAAGAYKQDDKALAILEKYTKVTPAVTRQAPAAYWAPDGRINIPSIAVQQTYYLANKKLDYTQPLDLNKFIDYGPLDTASKYLAS